MKALYILVDGYLNSKLQNARLGSPFWKYYTIDIKKQENFNSFSSVGIN